MANDHRLQKYWVGIDTLFASFLVMFVSDEWLLVINNEQLEILVKNGNRPPLDAITGPADLLMFAKKWIAQCWHESPDERPSFDGK